MPRKDIKVDVRQPDPDPVYGSRQLAKFINHVMLDGKRSTAEGLVYRALEQVKAKVGEEDAIAVFKRALDNVRPVLEVKSRRVGGSNYQVPIEVYPRRRTSLAMRWLVTAARTRGERGFANRLANELLDAANNRGSAVKKKEDVHRMAEANKAFSHYRW